MSKQQKYNVVFSLFFCLINDVLSSMYLLDRFFLNNLTVTSNIIYLNTLLCTIWVGAKKKENLLQKKI